MKRTITDIPENDIETLDMIGARDGLSRAEILRRAVADYIEQDKAKSADTINQYFGMFKDDPDAFDGLDGVEYQQKIRAEWDGRDTDVDARQIASQSLHDNAQGSYEHGAPRGNKD